MKVILLQDIEKLGKKNEIKEVSDGYGRNFLLKQKLAKIATNSQINQLKKEEEQEREKREKEIVQEKEIAKKLEGMVVEIKVKVGKKDELFESINQQKICEKIKDLGFDKIKKEQILLKEPLKNLGDHSIEVNFKNSSNINIIVKIIKE